MILAGHGKDPRLVQVELPIIPNVGDRIREDSNPKHGEWRLDSLVSEGIFVEAINKYGATTWRVKLDNGKLSVFNPEDCEIIDRAPVLVEKEISLESLLEPFKENAIVIEGDENYTPEYFLAPCKQFLGAIDLDPFSCEIANRTIGANVFFTREDDALTQDWTSFNRKWVNPPYSAKLIDKAIAKTLEYSHIGETLLLVNTSSSAKWFQSCMQKCSAYLHPSRRIPFDSPFRTSKGSNRYDQTLFYFGSRPFEFAQALSAIGRAVQPISIDAVELPVIVEAIAQEPSKSVANLRMDEGSVSVLVEINKSVLVESGDRLDSLLEQKDKLINSGASPQGVWINCGKVPHRDFEQAVWKSSTPRKEWGDKKSQYIGKRGKEDHLSAIAQHRAGQELRKVEREIRKLQVKS